MKRKILKHLSWLALALLLGALVYGIKMDWLLTSLTATILSVFILLLEFEERHMDSRVVALVGVLVALTVCARQLLHGIEFSPVFFIVILAGYVYGFTVGFSVGALTMFTSNLFLGHGPWTPFQMFALGFTGALASLLPGRGRHEIPLLIIYSIALAFLYGVFMDLFSWMAFIPTHTLESLAAIVSAGMIANTARALGNIFFMALLGPVFLRVLRRFRRRLTYEYHA